MSELSVRSEPLGGSELARAVAEGALPGGWVPPPPADVAGWLARASATRRDGSWLDPLRAALDPAGAALERLGRVADAGGVVVTTGQQPGLFGGPLYTWYKAFSALALADEVEQATGIPCAPLFWAATDDADLAEAASTGIVRGGHVEVLRMPHDDPHSSRAPLSEVPLGDLSEAFRKLEAASGATVHPRILEIARAAYRPEQTVGGAYVELLRAVLGPHGICVLDAAHPAVGVASLPVLRDALLRAEDVSAALRERGRLIRDMGHAPQVADVAGLSLVFERRRGDRQRVRVGDAAGIARDAGAEALGPNVLLRPVVERCILPTIAYVAGPGELAYFAQVGAVAEALHAAAPLAVPRWSGMVIEPHVARLLDRLALRPRDVRDPATALGRLAREAIPPAVLDAMTQLRSSVDEGVASLGAASSAESPPLLEPGVVEGHRRVLQRRLDRLERRVLAAQKRREMDSANAIEVVHAALYPGGRRQERVLNLLPLLARHGPTLLELVLARAREHAADQVRGAAGAAQPS